MRKERKDVYKKGRVCGKMFAHGRYVKLGVKRFKVWGDATQGVTVLRARYKGMDCQ